MTSDEHDNSGEHSEGYGKRPYKSRDGNGYRPRGDRGDRDGRSRGYGDHKPYGGRSGGYRGDGDRHGYRPRDSDSGEHQERRSYGDRNGGYRGHGDGERRSYRPRDSEGSGERRSYGDRNGGYRLRDDHRGYRPRDSDSGERQERRSYGDRNGGDRGYRPRDSDRSGERRSYGDRNGGYRDRNGGDRGYRSRDRGDGYRPRGDRGFGGRREGGFRGRDDHGSRGDRPRDGERKLFIPEDVEQILFKGADLEAKGRADLAQILYLHGAARLSSGCENSLIRMLGKTDSVEYPAMREKLKKECPEEILPLFDYACSTVDQDYDVDGIRASAHAGNPFAIYCLVRMGEVEKEDDLIDLLNQSYDEQPEIVTRCLETLSRKPGSEKAKAYLDQQAAARREKETIRTYLKRAVKGDESAVAELDRLSESYPEARFLRGYVEALKSDGAEAYIRDGIDENEALVFSYLQELSLPGSGYAKYLAARKLQSKGEPWVPLMVEAVKCGSEEALDALSGMEDSRDVNGPLQAFYMSKGDVDGLIRLYNGRDSTYLEGYCDGDVEKILDVGKRLGGEREIHWLGWRFREGHEECKDALVAMAQDSTRYGKTLIYALHDCGADMEAATVYFNMIGNPELPAVKWLSKVCEKEDVKEFVRSKFEEMNDLETFDSIFVDDGYVPRYKMRQNRGYHDRRRY